ncbi:radical S-adenosyl methionine domain-containing protein 1, mitochondrial-like [Antedon mediterranea]|uniref:radical S-adenosyl methionine domain-containing protein 1, mitochondrial-like n=1 Tax=Antedon mediterranea TaxID=105859 RepID=UPI003AF5B8A9
MTNCLVKELQTLLSISGIKKINSIFFGGGTPSLADPDMFERIINEVTKHVYMSSDAEISMEANPTALEGEKLVSFKSAGVNRISIGLQALDQRDLNILGRDHSVKESMNVLHQAKTLFPGCTSIDLMFARPGQTTSSWVKELEEILKHADDHISLYQLTLERGTELFNWYQKGEISVPESDVSAEMYKDAVCMLAEAGYDRYEVSNFARPGAQSQHNQAYWSGTQYIGIGPGAHGRFVPLNQHMYPDTSVQRVTDNHSMMKIDEKVPFKNGYLTYPPREARIQTLEPSPWMKEVIKYGHGTRRRVKQSTKEILQEIIMLGMRTKVGISSKIWSEYSNRVSLRDIFYDNKLVRILEDGELVELTDGYLRPTKSGLTVADSVTAELILVLDKYCQDI